MSKSSYKLIITILWIELALLTVEVESILNSSVQKLPGGNKYSIAANMNNTPFETKLFRVNVKNPNQSIRLPCGAADVERFGHVAWKKGNQFLKISYEKDKSSLIVHYLNLADSGTYICHIHDSISGSSSSSVELVISSGTVINNQTVFPGFDANFNCFLPFADSKAVYETVVCKTQPIHIKEMDPRKIIKEGIVHILKNVTKQDEGWYTCLVKDPIDGKIFVNESAYLEVDDSNHTSSRIDLIVILIAIVLVIFIIILLSIMCFRKKPKRKYDEHTIKLVTVSKKISFGSSNGFKEPIVHVRRHTVTVLHNKTKPSQVFKYKFPYDSEWEIPRENLVLGIMLGKGVFGKVFLATMNGLVRERDALIAVKMLNAEHSDEDVVDLVHELEVMKMVGSHPNLINLLGCCSKEGPLYVIVDYAALGNLQSYLRKHRFESDIDQDDKTVIYQNQLLSFVTQIASGMEYLASIGCTHQDLKTRNVLVCEDYTVKITDYGRNVYNLDRFPKTTSGKIPIQWMAPESLLEYTFNEKSDVWSFGVTFWEVMTIGEFPFPDFSESGQLIEFLKQGNRLEQPKNCPGGAYTIMSSCWQLMAVNRPTFNEVVQQFRQLPHTMLLDGYSNVHDKWDSNRNSYAYVQSW